MQLVVALAAQLSRAEPYDVRLLDPVPGEGSQTNSLIDGRSYPGDMPLATTSLVDANFEANVRQRPVLRRGQWWTLGAVAFGLFMIMLDNTVVNVALPAIQGDLGGRPLRARMDRHRLRPTFAAVMLTGGKLIDMLGRRLIFVIGIVIFAVASLLCGLAESGELLIAWRIVQGVGAP